MAYSIRTSIWSVMPSSAKLGMGSVFSSSGSNTSNMVSSSWSSRVNGAVALLGLPKDKTLLKMLDIVVVVGAGAGSEFRRLVEFESFGAWR